MEYAKLLPANWTIIEPNPSPVPGVQAKYIDAMIDEHFMPDEEYDAFVHSHVLEHIYNPVQFMANISRFMPENSLHFCSFPNMEVQLGKGYTNVLGFEHTYFLKRNYAEHIFASANLEIMESRTFLDDHSIFYALKKRARILTPKENSNSPQYSINKELFLNYVKKLEHDAQRINESLENLSLVHEKDFFIFGGHVFTQMLLAFGVKADLLHSILDNNPEKQGKRLSGTNLQIQSPNVLRGIKKPYVICKVGAYADEIKRGLLNINKNVKFIE